MNTEWIKTNSLFIKGIDNMTEFLTNAAYGMRLFFKLKQLNEEYDKKKNVFKHFKLGLAIIATNIRYKSFIQKSINSIQEALNFLFIINTRDIEMHKVFNTEEMPSYCMVVKHSQDNMILLTINFASKKSKVNQYTNATIVFDRNDTITKSDKCVTLEKVHEDKKTYHISLEELDKGKDAKIFLAIIKQVLFELVE